MDIRNSKQAEELLMDITLKDDIIEFIESELTTWDFQEFSDPLDLDVSSIKEQLYKLDKEIFQEDQDDKKSELLQRIVFDRIHDTCLSRIKEKFLRADKSFFEKCRLLSDINITAEQFGANENYGIPLSAAIVELSVLDTYKTPIEKMNCLCTTYDLVFAEIKTAMISVISQNTDRENEIPVIDNRDIIPVLMVVIIKSKLVHMFSNLFYIKSFFYKMDTKRVICNILNSFEEAVDSLIKMNIGNLHPVESKVIRSLDLEDFIKFTSSEENKSANKTLVDEANQRVLNLITRSTNE